MDTHRFLSAE